jgi:hypothetical protein
VGLAAPGCNEKDFLDWEPVQTLLLNDLTAIQNKKPEYQSGGWH